jgi:hypothetical protein
MNRRSISPEASIHYLMQSSRSHHEKAGGQTTPMVSHIAKVEPFDIVVFGGTGDLAYRKLFPALFKRHMEGQLSQHTALFSASASARLSSSRSSKPPA